MKILHVFPSLDLGGSQKRLIDLLHSPFGSLHTHFFLSMHKNYGALNAIPQNVKYDIIEPPKKNSFIKRILSYRHILKSINPDLMLTYNWGTIEWALANFSKTAKRHIHLEDGFGPEEQKKTFWRRDFFRRIVLKNVDEIIVPSLTLKHIAQDKWKIPYHKLHYIPNGIDINLYQNKEVARKNLLKKTKLKSDVKLIGTIAGLRLEKNLSLMLESFAILPQDLSVYLIIMGSGSEETALKAKAKKLKISDRVFFLGHINKPWDYLPGLDLFFMTSITEQMPYSIIEAMASKLPIISTEVGDVKEMVSDENKDSIISTYQPKKLAEQLLFLLERKEMLTKISEQNYIKSLEDYPFKKMLEKHINLYRDLP